jgi:hypothetical protein
VSDNAGAKDQPDRHDVGTFVPVVPFLSPRDSVDLGPAGSLVQARDRERAVRLAGRPAVSRDRRVGLGCALVIVAGVLVALAVPHLAEVSVVGPLLLMTAGLAALVAVVVVCGRYQLGVVEADLSRQITRERAAACELDALRSLGWTVLHDRLVPGTEHRVAHVLAGPAGLIVATVVPVVGQLRMQGKALMTGGDISLEDWFATRWWEANQIEVAMGKRLKTWQWTGPTYPVALFPGEESTGLRMSLPNRSPAWFPLAHAEVSIRPTARVRQWATSLPAPLGRLASAQLAAALEAACLPAGTRD